MNIYFTNDHRLHDPKFEIFEHGQQIRYYESPDRIESVISELTSKPWAILRQPTEFDPSNILRVHSKDYYIFLKTIFLSWKNEFPNEVDRLHALYPSTHPSLSTSESPKNLSAQLGFYVKDLSAPLTEGTFNAAISSVNISLSAAADLLGGNTVAVGLCRPPGHHAGSQSCAGYCYFNNAAIAAAYLAQHGKVAILDIDYHAGNGTQEIFYESDKVLTISIHADPHQEYPYYAGFVGEIGANAGQGYHHNFPLALHSGADIYFPALNKALELISQFNPDFLVLSAGFDTFDKDPLGTFSLQTSDYQKMGEMISGLEKKTLVVLEGGYDLNSLGLNMAALLVGFEKS